MKRPAKFNLSLRDDLCTGFNYLVEQIGKRAELGFKVNPHLLRHSTGCNLANKGCDTRLIKDYFKLDEYCAADPEPDEILTSPSIIRLNP